ncbi:hypothetical protein Q5741_13720 [Paenibacillus sp. JX-17]|uniref:Uncharacterized protein n=1 Tax=Paenibacillus lacisoli TaxID=3064525 RepID=A0ABT9CFQ1_9BACL|nr:hypothetical protein [Paenibacillus sp. JX-17]MDO7907464.1 hypothetical protein [Paenibacillus sp. JX-17]
MSQQRKHIALSVYDRTEEHYEEQIGLTREELMDSVIALLNRAQEQRRRVIFGFDHNYSFPIGFYEALFQEPPSSWKASLERISGMLDACRDPLNGELAPRRWARQVNEKLSGSCGIPGGPFWGPRFAPKPLPEWFRMLPERRWVEQRDNRMKSIYQISGIGSVGQQSLYGMHYLSRLLNACDALGIPVHVWPQQGVNLPPDSHVLVEVYPTLYWKALSRTGQRSDRGDARACVDWISQEDANGNLAHWMDLAVLPDQILETLPLEGWVLGVKELETGAKNTW